MSGRATSRQSPVGPSARVAATDDATDRRQQNGLVEAVDERRQRIALQRVVVDMEVFIKSHHIPALVDGRVS